ncbi:MAG: OpgC domain-containing protein [Pigmentiphaga sp.]|nr:OpgC domain-containing protein [Pigmentiphaga sp.]
MDLKPRAASLPPPVTAACGAAVRPALDSSAARQTHLDALRGLFLVLMTSTHLPTWFGVPTSQSFGFVSAAEGFVFLSAYMAGLVYTRRAARDGMAAMKRTFWKRTRLIYACQVACLLFLFTVIAALDVKFEQPAATNLMSFYLQAPLTGLWTSLLMIYNPPLLDILPMYITYMLVSPWVLAYALQRGWRLVLVSSVLLWAGAQLGLSRVIYDATVALTGLPVPFNETGAFETFAWQLLWVLGMALGSYHARVPIGERWPLPDWLGRAALLVVVTFIIWRFTTGLAPFPGENPWNQIADKWHLAPLRLFNFLAWVAVLLHYGAWLTAHLPRIRPLEVMGSASLLVFSAHLVIVLMALAVFGESTPERPKWVDLAMFTFSVVAMYVVARVANWKSQTVR